MIEGLREKLDGYRRLRDCTAGSGWPDRGVYFFFEEGETRQGSQSLRVTRVGTHALTLVSKTSLWQRLGAHRGRADGGGGDHRGSIFRKRVGQALMARHEHSEKIARTWGSPRRTISEDVRSTELPLERSVSGYIGRMPFLWVDVPNPPRNREFLEANCIALLSNFKKTPIDPASPKWLGKLSTEHTIQESGLWNTRCVEKIYDPMFLGELSTFIEGQSR